MSPALEPTIGLEVHVQLATRTKLFCRCPWRFGAPPNTLVCPVCLGHPGVLPVLNREALRQGIRAALALGLEVQPESKFDRKNYFYPDLPKGYQISQFDEPLAREGFIELEGGRRIGIERLHLEEDAGKAIHDRGDFGLVDFNRAGAPLAEIVSRPEIRSAEEARDYLERLKRALRYARVGDCDMEKGNLRVDVNLSMAPPGKPATGTRAEIKNLNSFASVVRAIGHEAGRQAARIAAGGEVVQETRLWDEASGRTRSMRGKEEAADYRYFPEPDLPRLRVDPAWVESLRAGLPEPAEARRERYTAALGLSAYAAGVLTAERETADFFEALLAAGIEAREAANWVANFLLSRLDAGQGLGDLAVDPGFLADALALARDGRTNRNGVKALLDARLGGDGRPAEVLLAALGLEVKTDSSQLRALCLEAIQARPGAAEDFRQGKEKALGALMGYIMQATGGTADPRATREILAGLLRD